MLERLILAVALHLEELALELPYLIPRPLQLDLLLLPLLGQIDRLFLGLLDPALQGRQPLFKVLLLLWNRLFVRPQTSDLIVKLLKLQKKVFRCSHVCAPSFPTLDGRKVLRPQASLLDFSLTMYMSSLAPATKKQ